MAKFTYTAYTKSGVKQQAALFAASKQEAEQQLKANGLLIIEIKQHFEHKLAFRNSTLTVKDIEFFTTELALLLKSGLRLDRGLTILQQNVENQALANLLDNILQEIKQGHALSDALAANPAFDSLYIGLVKIAEETGQLADTFAKLSQEMKYQLELSAKIKQALVYPSVILFVCILALLFIFNFVVPNMSQLFRDAGNLPWYTSLLLDVSDFFVSYQIHLGVVVVLLSAMAHSYRDHQRIVQVTQWAKERLPIVRSANLMVERIRFSSAIATMLSAGLAIDKVLQLASATLRTQRFKFETNAALDNIRRGNGLASSLGETSLFPPFFASLLTIGEESAELEQVFNEIADRSRTQFYAWVSRLLNLLEPLLIMVMGIIVGTVVVVMMLSISAVTNVDL
ncbi:type II secretion system F family protein [Rheinheimera sp. D18]|uniref:type II secretion system F family protein n=1 Tax=Rheinheimera sp. D18 TaxID=2545632 RepID=UPI0010535863|nr:type II secretion system F family protein [Rheinheimera sp. D18]QBL09790.1 type II secretion system F family protein [Rheinheimera sp. D18]